MTSIDLVFSSFIRWLRSEKTSRYLLDHPTARGAIIAAVHELNLRAERNVEQAVADAYRKGKEGGDRSSFVDDNDDLEDRQSCRLLAESADSSIQNAIPSPPSRKRKCLIGYEPSADLQITFESVHFVRHQLLETLLGFGSSDRLVESEVDEDHRPTTTIKSMPTISQTISQTILRSRRLSAVQSDVDKENDEFVKLPAKLCQKIHSIGQKDLQTDIEEYVDYIARPPLHPDHCSNTSPENQPSERLSAADRRLRELKDHIICDEMAENTVNLAGLAVRISKRVALAELVGKYFEERDTRTAMPRKRRKRELPRSSPNDRFTDLLFPATQRNKVGDASRAEARKKAKAKLSYWITLGEPLARMAQCFGYAYIDLVHPRLREQTRSLSNMLRQIVDAKLFPRKKLLDELTLDLLSKLRQRPTADNAIDPSPTVVVSSAVMGNPLVNEACSHQELLQYQVALSSGYKSQDVQPRSFSIDVEDDVLCNSTMVFTKSQAANYGLFQTLSQLDQQYGPRTKDSLDGQDTVCSEPNLASLSGSLDSKEYYTEDDDWRAKDPLEHEKDVRLESLHVDTQEPDPINEDFSGWESFIICSPRGTASIASTSRASVK